MEFRQGWNDLSKGYMEETYYSNIHLNGETPRAPTDLRADYDLGFVQLDWTENSPNAGMVRIWRKKSGGTYQLRDTVDAEQEYYYEAAPAEPGTYYYKVHAMAPAPSAFSNEDPVTIPPGPPPPPPYLPGWPNQTVYSWEFGPSVAADLDGSGDLELIVGASQPGWGGGRVYAWHANGDPVQNWPISVGGLVYSSPTVGDIDRDGNMEVVFGTTEGKTYVYDHDGQLLWHKDMSTRVRSSAVLADLDRDGYPEIIIADSLSVCVWTHDGGSFPGWPQAYGYERRGRGFADDYRDPSLAVGDIDLDGESEIVLPPKIWNSDGTLQATISLPSRLYSSPVLGNINSSPQLEIVAGYLHSGPRLGAWTPDGTPAVGWENGVTEGSTPLHPVLADIDLDGALEVTATGEDYQEYVYAWDGNGQFLREYRPGSGAVGNPATPVVGDVDSDGEPEIVVALGSGSLLMIPCVDAFNLDGTRPDGWYFTDPTYSWYWWHHNLTLCDLNEDGILDLALGVESGFYVWTLGNTYSADNIDWGSFRHDRHNTACYATELAAPTVTVVWPNGGERLIPRREYGIAWEAYDNVGIAFQRVYYSTDGGASWALIDSIDGSLRYYPWTTPYLASSTCRVKVVAFDSSYNSSLDTSNWNFSLGWFVVQVTRCDATGNNNAIRLARDNGEGTLNLLYTSGDDIYFTFSDAGGDSWAEPDSIGQGEYPALSFDSGGDLNALWMRYIPEDSVGQLCFARRTGEAWSDPVVLYVDNLKNMSSPSYVILPSDMAYVVWEQNPTGDFWQLKGASFYVHNPQASFLEELIDTATMAGPPVSPSIAQDSQGKLHLAWDKAIDIYYAIREEGGWTDLENISESEALSISPCIDAYAGVLHVVW